MNKKRKALKIKLTDDNIRKVEDMLDALAFLPIDKVTRFVRIAVNCCHVSNVDRIRS